MSYISGTIDTLFLRCSVPVHTYVRQASYDGNTYSHVWKRGVKELSTLTQRFTSRCELLLLKMTSFMVSMRTTLTAVQFFFYLYLMKSASNTSMAFIPRNGRAIPPKQ